MEEPHFVSCESSNRSSSESSKFMLHTSNFVEVKVEPDDVLLDASIKEEPISQKVDEEANNDDYFCSGQYENYIQPGSPAVVSDVSATTSYSMQSEGNSRFLESKFPLTEDQVRNFSTASSLTRAVVVEDIVQSVPMHFKSCGDDHESELFSCSRCGKICIGDQCCCVQDLKWTERKELNGVLQDSTTFHICKWCGDKFVKKSTLYRHTLKHKAHRTFICDFCGKVFSRRCYLQSHTLLHTGEKRYECALCGKEYYRKDLLQTHLLKHTGEKPHICTYCNKSFTQIGHLKTHILTHTGQKSHICSTCGKAFCRRSTLKIHVTTHTKMKPFCCAVCGKGFSVRFSLRRHMSKHTGSDTSRVLTR